MTLVGPAGQHLTFAQLEALWIQAGGSRATAAVAAAIALAESGGWTNNVNESDTGGTGSYGLWQINNGTRFVNNGSNYGGPNGWQNPLTNAQLAVAKYTGSGNSFRPWGTYTSGAYLGPLAANQGVAPGSTGGINLTSAGSGIGSGAANTSGSGSGSSSGGSGSPWYDDLLNLFSGSGLDPIGGLISGVSQGVAKGFEAGFVQIFRDLWDPVAKRIFWSAEVLFGLWLVILGIGGLVLVGLMKGISDNKAIIGAAAAAPETGGMSLLLGAGPALASDARHRREERQDAAEARRVSREGRQGIQTEQGAQRISIAERRVAVQESQEQRRVAAANANPPSGSNPELVESIDIARARIRARRMREARKNKE